MKRKVIDIDQIFDNFLVKYINENRGKFDEKEWESKIVNLYNEFLVSEIEELGGVAPINYYKDASAEELVELLVNHVEQEVSVPDALCEALSLVDCDSLLLNCLNNTQSEELIFYCVNILSERNSTIAFNKYFDLLLSEVSSEDLKELLAEKLSENAEDAKERALEIYESADSSQIYLLEIFARCKNDDRVFNLLINELKAHKGDLALYLSYVSKYGDEKALPVLLELIDDDNISYVDFKELKLAIECFGGEYTKQRDFSHDRAFNKLKRNNGDESERN